jgi:glucose/arabinose dehydrogenase
MGRRRLGRVLLPLALALLAGPQAASAAPSLVPIAGQYEDPVHVTSDPGEPNRVFVVERAGRIWTTDGGTPTVFLDISDLVPPYNPIDDRGLLSMAFAPDYATSGHVYVLYAGLDNVERIDEFTASGNTASLSTRRNVLEIEHDTNFHYGGQLQFGPDGYLYASTGDNSANIGGPAGDPDGNGQSLETLNGKVLRIDPRGAVDGAYSVPADNPYVGVPGLDEIWASGLRNPWRFSFDRLTGDFVLAEVGQDAWEEINFESHLAGGGRGDNYGWNCREGPDSYSGCSGDFTEPTYTYPHTMTGCNSITGGYVVRDAGLPTLAGRYLYADFCKDEVRSALLDDSGATDVRVEDDLAVSLPSSFGEDSCGRLLVVSLDGTVYRIADGEMTDCTEPRAALLGKRRQRLRRGARVTVRPYVDEAAAVTLTANVPGFKAKKLDLPAGTLATVSWKLGAGGHARLLRIIRKGERAKVRFRMVATDPAGLVSEPIEMTVRLLVKAKRP